MPKPGYYYYQNRRALIGIRVLAPFILWALLSRYGPPPELTALEIFVEYRVPMALGFIGLVAILFVVRRVQRSLNEPSPSDYSSRDEFLMALERYRVRMRYKHGWVYYRSQELWPE